jgi:hypothetical protein
MAKQCTVCKKFQKKHVTLDDDGRCPQCATAAHNTKDNIKEATKMEDIKNTEVNSNVELNDAVMSMLSGINTTSEPEVSSETTEVTASADEVTNKAGANESVDPVTVEATNEEKTAPKRRGRKPKDESEKVAKPAKVEKTLDPEVANMIKLGRKGVTNAQMIPAIKNAIDTKDSEKLVTLSKHFPGVYESSLKYISGKRKEELKHLVNE